jgi:beta-lactamase regulating signal transducer with metallopeptidase domain
MITHISLVGVGLLVLKSSLLLAFGWCASRLLHRASAAARHLVWLTVIVGVLVMPVVGWLAPVPFRVLPAQPLPPFTATSSLSGVERTSPATAPIVGASRQHVEAVASRTLALTDIDVGRALVGVWAVVALVLSLRLLVGMMSVSRLARRGEPLVTAEWSQVLAEAARRVDVTAMPRLVMSDQVDMAFAFHATSPAIIVPASAREWSHDRRRAVLLHELAHIQRRDLLSHAVAGFVCALNWYNPFIWSAARQLRVESEMASDEIVLRAGIRPSVYAQHLLDMVTSFGRRAPAVALAMARPKEFEGRLVAILEPERRRPSLARGRSAVVGLVALPAIAIGAVAPAPRVSIPAAQPILEVTPSPRIDSPIAAIVPAPHAKTAEPRRARADGSVGLSRDAVALLLRFGTSDVVNPMMMLLREADSLNLTGQQADSIATLNRRYMIQLNRIWSPVSSFYASHQNWDGPPTLRPGSDPTRATIQALAEIVPALDGLLTPEQRRRVSRSVGPYLDTRTLTALVSAAPGGVFMSPQQLYGIRGHGRGGG